MSRSRFFKAFAVAAALSIPLAACGSDDDDSADEPDTTVVDDTATDDTTDDTAMDDGAMDEGETIVDIAVGNEDFSTLVTALTEAGLVETLSGEGEFTVFAPTNEAFDALPEGTLDDLLADPQGALTEVLLYHVVDGTVLAETVITLDGESVETLNGESVTITVDGDTVMVNDATVTVTDIEASNGVIHVIDAVLVP